MTTVNKKRTRISSPSPDSDKKVQGNPKTHENGQSGDAAGREKRLKYNSCYVCDGKDNWVLVCHGEECLISIHQSCTSDEPDFDEYGNFYCPYCWYKRLLVNSLKLKEKLLVIEKSRKGRETYGGVDFGLIMDKVSEDIGNVVEAECRRVTIVSSSPIGNRRECDESYEKFMAMEKDQRMKEVVDENQSHEASEAGDDDEGRQKRGIFCEKNHETSDAGEGIKGRPRGSEKIQERKKQRQCDISHETAQAHSFVGGVSTRKQRRYSEKSQQNERLAEDVFINYGGTEARDSDLGEDHENNQKQKASSTEICEQGVLRTDKRVSHGPELGEGTYKKERLISTNGDRKQKDMRNDGATLNEQANGLRKDEPIEHNSASSPISTDNVNDTNAASQELALIIHPGVQERPIEAQPVRSFKYGDKGYLEKNGTASDDPEQRRLDLCSNRKRRRLFWTQAEEEMLRVGVQKFPGFKNIPWRKILEFGRNVFNEERVPSDLKDKWKNMNKMSTEAGKWVSLPSERQSNYLVSEPFE